MCLGIPGKVISKDGEFAEVDFGGVRRRVSLLFCPEAEVGDYVLVHVGFAIQRLQEEEALQTLELLQELGERYLEMEEGRT